MLRFGRIPRKGERWKGRFADFVIEDATPTSIRRVRMILPPVPEAGARMTSPRIVTLIRGDGIGPEVSDAVVAILEAAGAPLAFEEVVVGREAEKTRGRSPSPLRARGDPPDEGRAEGAGGNADRQGLRSRSTSACGRRSTSTRTCAPSGTCRASTAASRASTSSSCARTPRTSTRPRAHGRARRRRVAQDHHRERLDPHRAVRLRVRARSTAASA